MTTFRLTFPVRWADVDPNHHVRHSVYPDYATHVRFAFLARAGFSPRRFAELAMGPVIFREETRFHKEVRLGDELTVDFVAAGLAPDGSRWTLRHNHHRGDGEVAAVSTLDGAWMSLETRKIIPPPPDLLATMEQLDRSDDFEELPAVGSEKKKNGAEGSDGG